MLPLGNAVAHRWNAARHLRNRTGVAHRALDQRRIAVEGLMRGQHVVVRSDDADIRPAGRAQGLLVGRIGSRETMREIRAGQRRPRTAAQRGGAHSFQIVAPVVPAPLANALGDIPDACIQGCVEAAHGGIVPYAHDAVRAFVCMLGY
jgi:hypothetical protein